MSIVFSELAKSYDRTEVLHGVSLEIPAGQIVGYIGPNGAGKTTTVKILTGMMDSFGGSASICGFDVRRQAQEVKRRIGYVPETAMFYDPLSPRQYLRFLGLIHGLDDATIERRTSGLLDLLGLAAEIDSPLQSLSKGMRQKVLLGPGACWPAAGRSSAARTSPWRWG